MDLSQNGTSDPGSPSTSNGLVNNHAVSNGEHRQQRLGADLQRLWQQLARVSSQLRHDKLTHTRPENRPQPEREPLHSSLLTMHSSLLTMQNPRRSTCRTFRTMG